MRSRRRLPQDRDLLKGQRLDSYLFAELNTNPMTPYAIGMKTKAPTPNTALKKAPPGPRPPPSRENSANMTPAIIPRRAETMRDPVAEDTGVRLLTSRTS